MMESLQDCDETGAASPPPSFFRAVCHTACHCLASAIRWMPVIFLLGVLLWSYYAFVVELVAYRVDSIIVQVPSHEIFFHDSFKASKVSMYRGRQKFNFKTA